MTLTAYPWYFFKFDSSFIYFRVISCAKILLASHLKIMESIMVIIEGVCGMGP